MKNFKDLMSKSNSTELFKFATLGLGTNEIEKKDINQWV